MRKSILKFFVSGTCIARRAIVSVYDIDEVVVFVELKLSLGEGLLPINLTPWLLLDRR